MNKLITAALLAISATSAFAMPTKAELKKAQPLVVELMAPAMATYKSAPYKEKSAAAAKVGEASAEFAKAAETEAAKFLLLKGAVSFYARGEQYDKAAETVTTLQREIKDVPPAVIAEITGKATGRISETKAPALYALYRTAKLQVRASEEAKALAAKLKKAQSDALQRKYAEALAVSGDWKAAYAEFAKVRNAKLQAIVKDESSGSAKNADAGEFWWAYEPAMEDAEDFFKSHAAAFYRKALDAGEITGLKKNIIEQRIKDVKPEIAVGEASCLPTTKSTTSAVVRQDAAPTSSGKAWQEKGNTAWLTLPNGEKIKFIKCPKGKFNMLYHYAGQGDLFPAKMNHEFWISDRLITRAHEASIFPEKGIAIDDDSRKQRIDKNDAEIDAMTDRLQLDFGDSLPAGYIFRLPSIAEYEYAYHAGTKDPQNPYFSISPNRDMINRITSLGRASGQNEPNAWGIHDMICYQKFFDRIDPEMFGKTDPEGAECFGKSLFLHEIKRPNNKNLTPFYWSDKNDCYEMYIWHDNFKDRHVAKLCSRGYHFHLVVGPDLVSEWRAKHGKK